MKSHHEEADKTQATAENTAAPSLSVAGCDPRTRRYVGVRETAAYVAFDMSQSFNIDNEREFFVKNILMVDLRLYALIRGINAAWDVANDLFTGLIVDSTQTRWGKFKPYLMFLAIPGTLLAACFWLMPLFGLTEMGNFWLYLVLQLLMEGVDTFHGMARTGIQATLTPYPLDRTRLITLANLVSGALGEKIPQYVLQVFADQLRKGRLGGPAKMSSLYVSLGVLTTIIGGIGAFWFFYVCKERVIRKEEKPTMRQSIRMVLHNRPVLLLTLSETLAQLSFSKSKGDYVRDVLDRKTLQTIVGIPAAAVNPISYALVPRFQRRFSNKALYIMGTNCISLLNLPVYFFGCIGGSGKDGMYQKIVPMAIAMTLHETAFTFLYGVRSVIPTEMRNESMDYCEWKNGFRGEGMIAMTKGLATKLANAVNEVAGPMIQYAFGYDQKAYKSGGQQTDRVKFVIFTLYAFVPAITNLIASVPILFYNLGGEERERMYAELHARRAAIAARATGEADTAAS